MDIFLVQMMVVFVLAVLFGIGFRFFKLPSLVGQVLAGLVIGMTGILSLESVEMMKLFSTLGVTLLLFLVGLEMNWKEIRLSGKVVIKLFLVQAALLVAIFVGFSLLVLKLSFLPSLIIALALTFSSTILVVKQLSEDKDLNSYVGKISLGVLLLQDLTAIVILALVPGFKGGFSLGSLEILLFKIVLIFLVINVVGHFFVSWLMKRVIKSAEDLILFSLVWFFLSVYFSTNVLQLTPEVGGILAGLSLSTGWGHFQIVSKVRTLRDIFLTIFFVLLGLTVGSGSINWVLVAEIVLMAVVGKFLVTWMASLWCGLKSKTAFSVSLNMTQISEFGLIVMSIGLGASLWGNELISAVTVAGLISMVLSTMLMSGTRFLYKSLTRVMPKWFKSTGREGESATLKEHIVLLGGDRTGRSIMSFLSKSGETVLVVDFNPEIVQKIKKRGGLAIFADVSDPDVIDLCNMAAAKMVISTVKDIDDSLAVLTELKTRGIEVPVIVDAESASQAAELYKAGASYVIFPHFVSGLHLGQLMKKFERDTETLSRYRSKQNEALKEIYEGEF